MTVVLKIAPREVGDEDQSAGNGQAGPRKRSGPAIEV
jgi:hypothetical protein